MEQTMYELLKYIRDFFPGDRWTCAEEPIQGGKIVLPGLEDGDFYLIEGSRRNDGIHIYGKCDLRGETLSGYITECRIPPAILSFAEEIDAWKKEHAAELNSLYQSESFGGYTHTLRSGFYSWIPVFAPRLRTWRKL